MATKKMYQPISKAVEVNNEVNGRYRIANGKQVGKGIRYSSTNRTLITFRSEGVEGVTTLDLAEVLKNYLSVNGTEEQVSAINSLIETLA